MLDNERIINRINIINSNIKELRKISSLSKEDFLTNTQVIGSAKYFLQTSIEAMIDIGNHLIARLRFGIPENNFHTFELLAENNVINRKNLNKYRQMVRLRNILVHLYHIVNDEEVYNIIQNDLGDFEVYIKEILSFKSKSENSTKT